MIEIPFGKAVFKGLFMTGMMVMATPSPSYAAPEEPVLQTHVKRDGMVHTVSGTFEVKLGAPDGVTAGTVINALPLDKVYHGPLNAVSKGVMLAVGSPAQGGAGYVAMEDVTGTLEGKVGTFVLQHMGTLDEKAQTLEVLVVPGSGTGALEGIRGKLTIRKEGGLHSYDFDYSLEP